MKVLLLCRNYYPSMGGIETSIYQLSVSFHRMGYETVILTATEKPEISRDEPGEVFYLPKSSRWLSVLPPVSLKKLEKSMAKCLKDTGLDKELFLVVGRDTYMTLTACRFLSDVPIIYIPSMDVKQFYATRNRKFSGLKDFILYFLEHWQLHLEIKNQGKLLNTVQHNIVFCRGMKEQLENSYNRAEYKIDVCYPGCTLEGTTLEKELNSNEDSIRFLYVGRVSAEKNLEMLLEAASLLTAPIELTIVGDGYGIDNLKRIAKKAPKNVKIVFTGFQSNVLPYYLSADYFVLPSKYESFGQVIIESFTCGLPVIGFASILGKTCTAIDELVQDNVTGFVCNKFSAVALSDCMKKAIEIFHKPEKREAMHKACIEYASQNFSWDKLAECCIKNRES